MVLYATAIILQCLHHLHYAGCKRKGCRGCMGCVDGVVKVLDVKFDSETWLKVVGHHHRGLGIQYSGTCKTASDCIINEGWICAVLYSESKSF